MPDPAYSADGARERTLRNTSVGFLSATLHWPTGLRRQQRNITMQSGSGLTTGSLYARHINGRYRAAGDDHRHWYRSLLIQRGASALTLGARSPARPAGMAHLNISSGGRMNTGTGLTLIDHTGTVTVDGGTWNVEEV